MIFFNINPFIKIELEVYYFVQSVVHGFISNSESVSAVYIFYLFKFVTLSGLRDESKARKDMMEKTQTNITAHK